MIKILIYEYVTGGGLINEDLSSTLLHEAKLMTSRLHSDLSISDDVSFSFFLDERLKNLARPQSILINKQNSNKIYDENFLKKFDYVLPILPETNLSLYKYTKFLEEKKINKIISDKQTILSLSNKLSFYNLFINQKINVIPTYNIKEINKIKKIKKLVIKDKYGAGCSFVKIFKNSSKKDFKDYNKNYIVQPYIDGKPYSISAFFDQNDLYLLSINRQDIKITKNFIKLNKIIVNDKIVDDTKIYALLEKIKSILPKLYGYIGIDIIINKKDLYVVEINPRLTTSYIGLNETLGINLVNLIIGKKIKKRIISGKKFCINLNENK